MPGNALQARARVHAARIGVSAQNSFTLDPDDNLSTVRQHRSQCQNMTIFSACYRKSPTGLQKMNRYDPRVSNQVLLLNPDFKALLEPFKYITSNPGKEIRGKLI